MALRQQAPLSSSISWSLLKLTSIELVMLSNHQILCCPLLRLPFVAQSLSCVRLFATPWTATHQASLSFTISWSLLKLMSIEPVMPPNHLILCYLLFLPPSIFPSTRVFFNELALCTRWPKYFSFSFSISPSNEYSGLIAFKIDWFDFLAVQETLKRLLQHYSSKASILRHSTFFIVQLIYTHDYWKNHNFDYMDFVGKVISLLF